MVLAMEKQHFSALLYESADDVELLIESFYLGL